MPQTLRPVRRALLLALPALGLAAPGAEAHALVMASTPEAGSQLRAAPAAVALRFNSRIDHGRSRLTLHGPDNSSLPLALAPETNAALVEAPLPTTLVAGAWRLRWQVLAVDGHITRGDIFFTILGR